jgi:hypothetical protein
MLALFLGDSLLKGGKQSLLNTRRHCLRLHSLKDLQGPSGRVTNYPTVGALIHMALNLTSEARIN